MNEVTAEQADRIEKKLDMIIDHFDIGDDGTMNPVEIRLLARANHNKRQERWHRQEQNKLALQQDSKPTT